MTEDRQPAGPTRTLVMERWSSVLAAGAASAMDTIRRRASSAISAAPGEGSRRTVAEPTAPVDDDSVDYRLHELIAGGGMGMVYRAHQQSLGRDVVLKTARDESVRDEIAREATLLGGLEHPNIVPVYELGEREDGSLFYAMRRVEGEAWSQRIGQGAVDADLEILDRVADAVAFAHSRGVIHCDLKPANVLIGAHGQVVLVDWGVAMRLGERESRPLGDDQAVGGTPAYMAPELARAERERIGPQTDIYLLGAILFEIATGAPPHRDADLVESLIHAAENRLPDDPGGEAGLLAVAERCLADRAEDRYPDVPAFQAALAGWRQRREAMRLVERADASFLEARRGTGYRDHRRALHALDAAAALWPEIPGIGDRRRALRRDFAQRALECGDLELASEVVGDDRDALADLALRIEVTRRQARRRRMQLATLRVGVPLLLVAAVGVVLVFYRDWSAELARVEVARNSMLAARDAAQADRQVAVADLRRAERQRLVDALQSARILLEEEGQRDTARRTLEEIPAADRGWYWQRLHHLATRGRWTVPIVDQAHQIIAWHPGDQKLIVTDGAREIVRFDVAERRELDRLSIPEGHPAWIQYDADDRVVVGTHAAVHRCDFTRSRVTTILDDLDHDVWIGACDRDHAVLMSRWGPGQPAEVVSYELATGRALSRIALGRRPAEDIRIHEGRVVLYGGDYRIYVAPVADLDQREELAHRPNGRIKAGPWNDEAKLALVSYGNGSTGPIDLEGERGSPWFTLARVVARADFSRDGRRLAVVDLRKMVAYVRDTFADQALRRVPGDFPIEHLDLDASGRYLALRGEWGFQVVDLELPAVRGYIPLGAVVRGLPGLDSVTVVADDQDRGLRLRVVPPTGEPRIEGGTDAISDGVVRYRASEAGLVIDQPELEAVIAVLATDEPVRAVVRLQDAGLVVALHESGASWFAADREVSDER